MNSAAGVGALLIQGREIPVEYDLIQSSAQKGFSAEGQVFGDADALRAAFSAGPCQLRLKSGGVTQAVLLDCDTHGAADIRIIGPMK